VKKQITEAFEFPNESHDINTKIPIETIISEIENSIFELTGKNSKDKPYREKAKKIISRLKGNRNSNIRETLKSGLMSASEFCKLSDKQLDDDSYFEKFFTNLPGVTNEAKPKTGVRPPIMLKNIQISQVITILEETSEGVNDYYNGVKAGDSENAGEEVADKRAEQIKETLEAERSEERQELNLITTNEYEDKVKSTHIETNLVMTNTLSVQEEIQTIQIETITREKSPKVLKTEKIPQATNSPIRNNSLFNSSFNNKKGEEKQEVKQSEKLKELKELMEKQRLNKVNYYINL